MPKRPTQDNFNQPSPKRLPIFSDEIDEMDLMEAEMQVPEEAPAVPDSDGIGFVTDVSNTQWFEDYDGFTVNEADYSTQPSLGHALSPRRQDDFKTSGKQRVIVPSSVLEVSLCEDMPHLPTNHFSNFADDAEFEEMYSNQLELAIQLSRDIANQGRHTDYGKRTVENEPQPSTSKAALAELHRNNMIYEAEAGNQLDQPCSASMETEPNTDEISTEDEDDDKDENENDDYDDYSTPSNSQVDEQATEGKRFAAPLPIEFTGASGDEELMKKIKASEFSPLDLTFKLNNIEEFREILIQMQNYRIVRRVRSLVLTFVESGQVLEQEDIYLIDKVLDLRRLENVELNCGIWKDVEEKTINNFFRSCRTSLTSFKIKDNAQGEISDSLSLEFVLPEMERLELFSFCEYYNLKDLNKELGTEPNQTEPAESKPINVVLSLQGKFINLKKLAVGRMISFEDLTNLNPENFPTLEIFKIRSSWYNYVDLSEFPIWVTITELEFPDCMENEDLVDNADRLFPQLVTARMNLPSPMCLRRFLFNMRYSNLKKFYLRFRYDFPLILESALQTTPFDAFSFLKNIPKTGFNELQGLKNLFDGDRIYKEFVDHYLISLPLTQREMQEWPAGIQSLRSLKKLYIKHIPRQLKIPVSNLVHFSKPGALFHFDQLLGFMEYSVYAAFLTDSLTTLERIQHKNIYFVTKDWTIATTVIPGFLGLNCDSSSHNTQGANNAHDSIGNDGLGLPTNTAVASSHLNLEAEDVDSDSDY